MEQNQVNNTEVKNRIFDLLIKYKINNKLSYNSFVTTSH